MGIMNGAKKGTPLDDEGRPVDVDLREMPQVKLPLEKSDPYVDFSFNDYPELLEDLQTGFDLIIKVRHGEGCGRERAFNTAWCMHEAKNNGCFSDAMHALPARPGWACRPTRHRHCRLAPCAHLAFGLEP